MPERPFLNRILGGTAEAPLTPLEVQDSVRKHDSQIRALQTWQAEDINPNQKKQDDKIDRMDKWLTQVAEPTLNLHDDDIAGLKSRVDITDKKDLEQDIAISAVNKSIPDVADDRITRWAEGNFNASCDAWFSKTSIDAKSKSFIDGYDLGPKLKTMFQLPTGLEHYDIGEILGVMDRVGSRLEALPKLAVSQPEVAGFAPKADQTAAVAGTAGIAVAGGGTAAGAGIGGTTAVTGSEMAKKGGTIRNVDMLEDRFTKLTQTYWSVLVGLAASWSGVILPNMQEVSGKKASWSDASDFIGSYKSSLADLIAGRSSVFDGRIASIAEEKTKSMAKILGSTLSLPTDQAGFLTDMTSADGVLDNKKPKEFAKDAIRFHYNNFRGRTDFDAVLEGSRSKLNSIVGDWWNLDSIKDAINRRNDAWLGFGDTKDVIKGYMQDFWNRVDFGSRLESVIGSDARFSNYWGNMKSYYDRWMDIRPSNVALLDIRDKLPGIKTRIANLRAEIKTREDKLSAIRDKLSNFDFGIDELVAKHGWKALFGIAGAAWAGASITEEILGKIKGAISTATSGFSEIVNLCSGMRLKLQDMETEVSGLETTMKSSGRELRR